MAGKAPPTHASWLNQVERFFALITNEWIRRRFEEQFGAHGDWLVDFFHLGEYLAEAGKSAGLGEGWLGSAIERDLPIGSGLTEGPHRHVLHPKLKVPEAWLPSKAHDIAQLIFVRLGSLLEKRCMRRHFKTHPLFQGRWDFFRKP